MQWRRASMHLVAAAAVMLLPCLVLPSFAQDRVEELPQELEGLGIFQRNGDSLPMDLKFQNSQGIELTLGEQIDGSKPFILTLVYYDCPMLCNILLDNFVKGLKELDWTAGQEFEIVTVSIDPAETVEQARFKKAHQIENYGRPSARDGWHFLIGSDENVHELSDAVGFKFAWNDDRQEFMHAAGIFMITEDGVISQTIEGLAFEEKTLRLGLVEASAGEIGSFIDHATLFCFYYDSESGRYAPAAMNLMRLGAGLVAIILVGWLVAYWIRDRAKRKLAMEGSRL